jgi:Na+/melibiose symporter-like transporter
MLDLGIFCNLQLSLGSLLGLLVYMVVVTADFILPFFLELVKHYPPGVAGLLLMVFPIWEAAIAPVAGILSDRLKPRIVSFMGLLLLLVGCWGISMAD